MKNMHLSFVYSKKMILFIAVFAIMHPIFSQIRLENSGTDATNQFIKKIGEYVSVDLVKRGDYYGIMYGGSFIVQPEFEEIEEVKSSRSFHKTDNDGRREETGANYIPVIAKRNGMYGLMTITPIQSGAYGIIQDHNQVDTIIPFLVDAIEYTLRPVVMYDDSREAHCFYFQKGGKWGLYVPNYRSVPVPCVDEKPIPIFDYASHTTYICGFIVKTEGKYGILANGLTEEKKYYMSLAKAYDDIRYYNSKLGDNYLVIKKDGKCGFIFDVRAINNDVELPFEDVLEKNDSDGYFAVKDKGKWGFVRYGYNSESDNYQYIWIVKPIYDEVENIEEYQGSTNVWRNGKKYRLVWDNRKDKYVENKY